MRIVLIAEESAGMQVLRALARAGHPIQAVLTREAADGRPRGLAAVAASMGVTVWPAARVRDPALPDDLRRIGVDLLLNVHSLYVVPDAVLGVPALGAFNLHPGPLPRYAGLNCPSWAIYRHERAYGVTVHRMASRIDAGAIAYQATFPVADDDTGFTLTARCIEAGVPLVLELVATAARAPHAIPAVVQDLAARRYFGREVPEDGVVRWARPARDVSALVRAADYHPFPSPWGHPRARLAGRPIGIVKAARTGAASTAPPGTVRVRPPVVEIATADEWLALRLVHRDGLYVAPDKILTDGARLEDGPASAAA